MNKNIEQLLTLVASASDKFMEINQQVSTTVGLLDQSSQASNAITVDNIKLGQKLMFIILDAHPDIVGIGVGETGTVEFTFIDQYPLTEVSITSLVELMQQHLEIVTK